MDPVALGAFVAAGALCIPLAWLAWPWILERRSGAAAGPPRVETIDGETTVRWHLPRPRTGTVYASIAHPIAAPVIDLAVGGRDTIAHEVTKAEAAIIYELGKAEGMSRRNHSDWS